MTEFQIVLICPMCESRNLIQESAMIKATVQDGTETETLFEARCMKCGTIQRLTIRRFFDSTNPNWVRWGMKFEEFMRRARAKA